ncbi:MAG: tRNA isopentenyl-2-thiomethyl-A-37 hydroxylase MiaE [Phycisphaeraceae bacterium]|nr:tRNA isopentenyl-2-thiomethyl-A-37 hydroxylase MiaE [Phycisphaeraceae bacterium]
MAKKIDLKALPLHWKTPADWATAVLTEPLKLLNDHAHLEKKAAANALELLNRWPEPNPPLNWVTAMTAIARDEAEHLGVVTRLLARRGGRLSRGHRNGYATALRAEVRAGEGPKELVDRLLISALIEARSCERFALLAGACTDDAPLAKLYRGLWASEHGHYLSFLQLAEGVMSPAEVRRRWQVLLKTESRIVRDQPPGPRMHSGLGGD